MKAPKQNIDKEYNEIAHEVFFIEQEKKPMGVLSENEVERVALWKNLTTCFADSCAKKAVEITAEHHAKGPQTFSQYVSFMFNPRHFMFGDADPGSKEVKRAVKADMVKLYKEKSDKPAFTRQL
jgi:hypothetical protein